MTTTLANCRIELSKQLDDYWAGTSTTPASAITTELTDTALKAKANDWIADESYDLITDDTTNTDEERKISALVNSTGAITMLAHTSANTADIEYEIHRLFTASEKRRALIYAARTAFPWIHEKIWDESMVSGNWLKDGSFEIWTDADTLTHWTETDLTLAQTSTAGYFRHGAYSAKLSGSAGTLVQEWKAGTAEWDDLKNLRGQSVTFTIQAWADTASDLRISVNDGTTQTYSEYHAGDDAWTQDDPRNDSIYVTQYIDPNATQVTFTIHWGGLGTAAYVDDARVIGPYQPRLFIEDLGLAQEMPYQVFIESEYYGTDEPWALIHNAVIDTELGFLYLPSSVMRDRRLRIRGLGYLNFYDTSGDVGTDWDDTININAPQTDILIAQAILWLYTRMAMPNFSSGDRQDYQQMMGFWEQELRKRIGRHGMDIPSVPTKWR